MPDRLARDPRGRGLRQTTPRPDVPSRGTTGIAAAAGRAAHRGWTTARRRKSSQQRSVQIDPCSRVTCRVPARSWRPSTFWVSSAKAGRVRLQAARTSCARFGWHAAMSERRQSYHSHTSAGSRAKAPGVARSSARNWRHRPPVPRKVGTPLAADTPAPVSTVIRPARASLVEARARSAVTLSSVALPFATAALCGWRGSLRTGALPRRRPRPSQTAAATCCPRCASRWRGTAS